MDTTLEVNSDIKERNFLRPVGTPYKFEIAEHGESFAVFIEGGDTQEVVTFFLIDKEIVVKYRDGVLFEASLTLNDEGECRFKINGEELESWQLRKRALESLFFEDITRPQRGPNFPIRN